MHETRKAIICQSGLIKCFKAQAQHSFSFRSPDILRSTLRKVSKSSHKSDFLIIRRWHCSLKGISAQRHMKASYMIYSSSHAELLLIVNQRFSTFSFNCVNESSHSLSSFQLHKRLIFTPMLRKCYLLTLNEEVDVAEYPLAPDTRDTTEPWRRKLDSDP